MKGFALGLTLKHRRNATRFFYFFIFVIRNVALIAFSFFFVLQQVDNTGNPAFKVVYCKDKVYAGVEEYSLEEIRSAEIFARMRHGALPRAPPPEEENPRTIYKVMYPKKEIYNFTEELQWEEVLAKHYPARLAQKRNSVASTQQLEEEPMDVAPLGESSFVQEPMEVASSQNSSNEVFGEVQPGLVQATVECSRYVEL